MRVLLALTVAILSARARAGSIVLIPLDNRPASGQYAEIIARIGGSKVLTPPLEQLGNYTIPGSPDAILKWLGEQDLSDCKAIIASTDMICYGSLFESRKSRTSATDALARLRRLLAVKLKAPQARLYLYSSVMRLTPSATHDAASYRLALAEYVVLRSRGINPERQKLLLSQIPKGALEEYDAARARNLTILKELVRSAAFKTVDFLAIGQDDASPYGPQVHEREQLSAEIESLHLGAKVKFCEGVDQLSSVLASRALLGDWSPAVRLAYSDESGKAQIAQFETQPIERTVQDQISVAGAHIAGASEQADYTLFLNSPQPDHGKFVLWLKTLAEQMDEGKPLAIADLNLSKTSGAPDPELYGAISEKGRPLKLLAYSAWNTVANTVGTSVAAANLTLLSHRGNNDSIESELAQKQFLLLRLANDFAYHTYTRQVAYGMPEGPRQDAIFGKDFYEVNDYVKRDLSKFLKKLFFENFLGRSFTVNGKEYEFIGMTDLNVSLPWPRSYEVRLEFELQAREHLLILGVHSSIAHFGDTAKCCEVR